MRNFREVERDCSLVGSATQATHPADGPLHRSGKELYSAEVPPFFELWWTRKVRLFAENLADNEHIVAGVCGFFRELRGRLVATETRLLFIERKGLFGSVVESFPYSRINEVATSKNILRGDLIINSGGSSETIKGIQKGLLTHFLTAVQHQLAEFRQGGSTGTPFSRNGLATELEKLAALRDRGVLSAEEFQAQKAKILRQ
jgi:Bacterial PH domain/Short C-terminal domain